jgi:hypothetical protein
MSIRSGIGPGDGFLAVVCPAQSLCVAWPDDVVWSRDLRVPAMRASDAGRGRR